uniref:EF-hand domain-containing protein n=1 Tax=Eutreptiella gymnastica TaxID=73025 RepID=A0A7S1IUQ2_9EUGL|mmetsp:Transcript_44528/g.79830  ORF Transcript_44528/g.79830 Transcript_44528/m.79830 type:complete len:253 (+) Transcript_44528:103-861(+)
MSIELSVPTDLQISLSEDSKSRSKSKSKTKTLNGGQLSTASEAAASGLPRALVQDVRNLFDHFHTDKSAILGLSPAELREALRAIGLDYTDNQVKDLIFNLSQSAAVKSRNRQSQKDDHAKSRSKTDRSVSVAASEAPSEALTARTARSTASRASSTQAVEAQLFLSFEKFVELLTITLEDCDPQQEFEAAFKVMDLDGDGAIGAADLKTVMQDIASEVYHDEEIREMLIEADWDDDQRVTVEDFKNVLDTN